MKTWTFTFFAIIALFGYGLELVGKACEPCRTVSYPDRISVPGYDLVLQGNNPCEFSVHKHHAECDECHIESSDPQPIAPQTPLKISAPEPVVLEPVMLSYYYRGITDMGARISPRLHWLNLSLRSVVLRT